MPRPQGWRAARLAADVAVHAGQHEPGVYAHERDQAHYDHEHVVVRAYQHAPFDGRPPDLL